MSYWYIPGTTTPTLLYIWVMLNCFIQPPTFTSICILNFLLLFGVSYHGDVGSLSSRIKHLEVLVSKTFRDETKRLEWHRKKVEELERKFKGNEERDLEDVVIKA